MGTLTLEDLPTYNYDDYKLWQGNRELIYGLPYAIAPTLMLNINLFNMVERNTQIKFDFSKIW